MVELEIQNRGTDSRPSDERRRDLESGNTREHGKHIAPCLRLSCSSIYGKCGSRSAGTTRNIRQEDMGILPDDPENMYIAAHHGICAR